MLTSSLRTALLATVATSPFLATASIAQEAFDLGEIIVSGGLSPVQARNYGHAVSILTEQDLKDLGATYVSDALQSVPSVTLSRTGGGGGLTEVRMRGHEAQHTLILIDGIAVADVSTGAYDLAGMLTADIARIEVLRGVQSAIYGSEAIGGVISITTKRAEANGVSGKAGVQFGSDGSKDANFALRSKSDRGELGLSFAGRSTDGFDMSGTAGGEKDGSINRTVNLNGSYNLTDSVSIGATLRHTNRDADGDDFVWGAPNAAGLVTDSAADGSVQETYGSAYLQADAMGGRLSNRIELTFGAIDIQARNAARVKNLDTTGHRQKLAYTASYALDAASLADAKQIVTVSVQHEKQDYKHNDAAAFLFGPPPASALQTTKRAQTSAVLEYQGQFENGLSLQASLRHDNNDGFKDSTTYSMGLSYTLPNGTTRLHGSAGTGVQNPTIIEQFGYFANFRGNPNLTPEKSRSFDFGVEQQIMDGRGSIDVTYFNDRLTDEIGADYTVTPNVAINKAGKSKRRGVEVGANLNLTDRVNVVAAYTWTDARNPDGSVEVRRPKHDASVRVNYTLADARTRLSLGLRHVAGNYDVDFTSPSFGGGVVKLGNYSLVDFGFTHALTDTVTLTGKINNVFDKKYNELDGYSTQGRTAFLGLSTVF